MSYILLDGRATANKILNKLKDECALLRPKIVVILVGSHTASLSYIRQKQKACEQVGIDFELINMPEDITLDKLLNQIHTLNEDQNVNGYIVQLPLPAHLQSSLPQIIKEINPSKDVDGFHAYNIGKMFIDPSFEDLPPATPLGIIKLLEEYKIDVKGKELVIVGHSNIVGKPISTMLLNRNATVTTCHIYTKDLATHTKRADILIVSVGKPNLITTDMVKDGVTIIDVGINRIETPETEKGYKLVGDVDFENIKDKAYAITPVPGGVGPMTVAALIINTVRATERQKNKNT